MPEIWYIDTIWISVAFLGGLLARRINLPPLIGFLAAGFVLSAFNFNSGGMALQALSELGVMLLLFTIGLKLNVRSLISKEIWLGTTIQMGLMTLFFGLFVFAAGFSGLYFLYGINYKAALVVGFALSFSSTVFAVKILEDRGEVNSMHGKISIGILVMQDIIAVLFLSIVGSSKPNLWLLALPLYLFVVRYLLLWLLSKIDHGELFTLFGFFAAFVLGAISFKFFGLKPDLGALVIGILIGSHERSKELTKHMMGYKDFFLVAFFLQIGLHGLPDWSIFAVALVLSLLLVVKGGFFLYLFTRFNFRARTSWLATLSLSNYSEFGLIVGTIGVAEGLISVEWITVLALALAFSFVISSPFNTRAHQLFNRYKSQITILNKNCVHPDDAQSDLTEAEYLVCGMGRIGKVVYHYLHGKYGDKVVGIDYDQDTVDKFRSTNKRVYWADATDSSFWEKNKFDSIRMVFIAMTDHTSNLNVAREIKQLQPGKFAVGSTSRFRDEFLELKDNGVDYVYNYYDRLGADFAENFVSYTVNKNNESELTINNAT